MTITNEQFLELMGKLNEVQASTEAARKTLSEMEKSHRKAQIRTDHRIDLAFEAIHLLYDASRQDGHCVSTYRDWIAACEAGLRKKEEGG